MRLDNQRRHSEDEVVDVVVVGTGAGGAPLLASLARRGLSVVALEAGPNTEPDDHTPDEVEAPGDINWMDERISGGSAPTAFGPNNSGTGVGGSTLHWGAFTPRPNQHDIRLRSDSGQGEDWPIDLALRVDDQLADGRGDGWRPDGLPADVHAYRAGLDALQSDAAHGDEHLAGVLESITAGAYAPASGALDADQLQAWAEDAAVDLAKQWMAHPATMAAVDYDGFANGGDGLRKQGFLLLGADEREAWEPTGAAR